MGCGRIRKPVGYGLTRLVDGELKNLRVSLLYLKAGQEYTVSTQEREYIFQLAYGTCETTCAREYRLGPRNSPFSKDAYALLVSRDETVTVKALEESLLGVADCPAVRHYPVQYIMPSSIGGGLRGKDNWQRQVRFVCWNDNTEANFIMSGETVTPSGNWSTIPPHRHQYDIPGEVPYEEVYLYFFSRPTGFGLAWQFDEEGLDQSFSLKTHDVLYMDKGYHPAVCGPGADLCHMTFMCGVKRQSTASLHPDYAYIAGGGNAYQNQKAVQNEEEK